MLYNTVRYAFYTLRRHPVYAALNVLGLSLALGCCLLLYWYVSFHLSFDRYHRKADRTVRLVTEIHQGGVTYSSGIPTPVGPALRQDMTWLDAVAMAVGQSNRLIQIREPDGRLGAKFIEEQTMAYVEPQFFQILDYTWLTGSPNSSLRRPFTAVLTRQLARKYFGRQNPVGRHLRMDNQLDLTITGLLDNPPDNTDQPYELLVSYATLNYRSYNGTGLNQWEGVSSDTHGWVLLPAPTAIDRFRRELDVFHRKRNRASLETYRYRVLPLSDVHTAPNYDPATQKEVLLVLGVIGGLLLLTACVNFINMATAQALRRGREIGVRRVIGATRRRVFWQFIVETALITSLAAWIAVVLAYAFLPVLRTWTDTPVPFDMGTRTWFFIAGLVLVVTVGAGPYPGLVLAGFRPALVLKGQATQQRVVGLSLRRLLVVGQLAINMAFIIAVSVLEKQLAFWLRADPGFDASHRVVVPVRSSGQVDLANFRADLFRVPGVEGVSFSFNPPTGGQINTYPVRFANRPKNEPFQPITFPIDSAFLSLYAIPLVAGRPLLNRDTVSGFLLNETAVRMLGFANPGDVLGRRFTIPYEQPLTGLVLGVVRDWRQLGFKKPVQPMVLYTSRSDFLSCSIRFTPGREATALPHLRTTWKRYFPNALYEEVRLDEMMGDFYTEEKEQLRFVQLAAGVAIAIGSVGLLGLIVFLTSRRTREIAIRKALGASEEQIVWLFLREFMYLLALAFGLAAPVVWWLMRQWLDRYEPRISLTPDLFVTGLVLVTVITLLTIGFQTLRTAFANPARALRTE